MLEKSIILEQVGMVFPFRGTSLLQETRFVCLFAFVILDHGSWSQARHKVYPAQIPVEGLYLVNT